MPGVPPLQKVLCSCLCFCYPRELWLKQEVTCQAQTSHAFRQRESGNTVTKGHAAGLGGDSAPDSLTGCFLPHVAVGLCTGFGRVAGNFPLLLTVLFSQTDLGTGIETDCVSLRERFEEQRCVFDKRLHILCGSSMFGNILPAFNFLLVI